MADMSAAVNREPPHVLVVDDDDVTLLVAKVMLRRKTGFTVTTEKSATKALDLLAQNPKVDLIVTDYHMPVMTGYDLLKRVKESSTLRDIPVVIISADKSPDIVNRCLGEGAIAFFEKPLKDDFFDLCKSIFE